MRGIKQFLRSHANIHRPGTKKNAFIFSMPRSGSTWLQELIWTQPGFKYVNEPLNLKGPWLRGKSGIDGFSELYNRGARDKTINYLKGFCDGKHHFLDPNPLRKFYRPFTSRLVFKIIHGAEYFINDIADACNGKVIFLIRHPFAVSLSRRVLPRIDVLCSDMVLQDFSEEQAARAKEIHLKGSYLEKGVLSWAIQNKIALKHRRDDWLVITYEQLTVDPARIVARMVRELELPLPERIDDRLRVPSAVKKQSEKKTVELMKDQSIDRTVLIERWRDKITPEEAEQLFEIIKLFELDIYSLESSYPDSKYCIV